MSSMIQMARPWVPTMRSRSRGWMRMSSTRTLGRPFMKRCQVLAPSSVMYMPNSVPTKSRSGFSRSSRRALMLPLAGRFAVTLVQVLP